MVLLLILNCVNVRRCLFNLYLHLTLAPRQMFRRTNQKTLMGKTRGIKNLIAMGKNNACSAVFYPPLSWPFICVRVFIGYIQMSFMPQFVVLLASHCSTSLI